MIIDGLSFTPYKADLSDITEDKTFVKTIHKDDNMSANCNDYDYYWMGKTALDSITTILDTLQTPPVINSILDFPSGAGRVLRYLKFNWPNSRITACDIDTDYVDFCAKNFDAIPVYSAENISDIRLDEKYDLIWVGSLFTHLDEKSGLELLSLLTDSLNENGLLIFTIAGEFVYNLVMSGQYAGLSEKDIPKLKVDFENNGIAHAKYLPGIVNEDNYGRTFIRNDWLQRTINKYSSLKEVAFIKRGYARRQDVIGWQKT